MEVSPPILDLSHGPLGFLLLPLSHNFSVLAPTAPKRFLFHFLGQIFERERERENSIGPAPFITVAHRMLSSLGPVPSSPTGWGWGAVVTSYRIKYGCLDSWDCGDHFPFQKEYERSKQ